MISEEGKAEEGYHLRPGWRGNEERLDQTAVQPEKIDHPAHYGGDTAYETIKVIEAWGLDYDFCLGNAVKYISRASRKGNFLEDLKKARWYLDRRIAALERKKDVR